MQFHKVDCACSICCVLNKPMTCCSVCKDIQSMHNIKVI